VHVDAERGAGRGLGQRRLLGGDLGQAQAGTPELGGDEGREVAGLAQLLQILDGVGVRGVGVGGALVYAGKRSVSRKLIAVLVSGWFGDEAGA